MADNLPKRIYVNRIKNGIVFTTKTGYKLNLLSPEAIKVLGNAKLDVDKDQYGEHVPK